MDEYRKELLRGTRPFRIPTLFDRAHRAGEERATEVLLYETSRLMDLSEKERISPFVVFQTAWALVLRRYMPTDLICFVYLISEDGSTAIRNRETTRQPSGLLICRAQLIEGSIINQLRQMQDKFDDGMLWKVQFSAEITQTLNDQLFNTAISVIQESPLPSLTQYSTPLSDKGETTKHDLVMDITHLREQINIVLKYDTSILSDSQAGHVVNTFVTSLNGIIANPGQDIEQLDPLSEQDRKQILRWGSTVQKKTDACVHSLIEDRARLQPDSQAICSWDGNMSYKDLDMISTQLANHLVYLGVGPEVMVPLCFEKSIWMIVAMLAVMKAGGVFVPLDSSSPTGRLESIIIQVRASVVLSSAQHERLLSSLADKVVVISESTLAQLPAGRGIPCTSVCPSNAVYVIFTSGSTGTPKGCVIEHASYCSSALGQGETLHIGPGSRVFQFASYSFDACLVEILTTLIFGGCICNPSEDERVNNMTQVINRMDVNWASFAPSVVRLIEPQHVARLKTLVLVGEAASQKDVDEWIDRVQLFNGYGPTECAVGCVYQELTREKSDARCIGRAVGAICWIVDISNINRLSPIGAVGELLIEGPCLGRGYLNDKTKTDAAFIRGPAWIPDDGTGRPRRLYRTGDLVQYNLDGTINFVGRKDSQVKIRGQRAELGEIEYHLTANPEVKSAIVVVRDSESRNRQLVAVVSLYNIGMALEARRGNEIRVVSRSRKGEAAAKVTEIRKSLSHKLPVYMIPATWMVVEGIPLLSSGKLHRAGVTTWIRNMGEEEFQAHSELLDEDMRSDPGSALEEQLQRIWGQVLNIPSYKVRMDKSFLNLGGDSISAIAVMARCRAANMVVTSQEILQCKTIRQLALNLRATKDLIYITESETEDQLNTPFELSPIQQFYFDLIHDDRHYFNQSFLLQLTKKISTEDMAHAIEAIIEQHSMLRARFRHESDGRWTQKITSEVPGSYQLSCHNSIEMEDIASTVTRSQESLNIQNGPVFAVDLFIGGDKQILFLTAHHLVIDLVSWRIVLSDLEEFLRHGTLSAPKPLPFQAWSRAQAKYCRQHLNPGNTLPFDIEEPDYDFWGMKERLNQFKDTMTEQFTIEREVTAKLFGICNNALRTEPVELLLSAVTHSFNRAFPERRTPAVFNEGHGREPWHASINLSRTVGWFTTLYPLWVAVDDREDVVKTIRHTKDQRRRIPDNGWSYFTSRFLHPEGSKAFVKHSEMEVLFNYEGIYQQLECSDAMFRQLPWATSQILGECGGDVRRLTLLEITATVKEGNLHFCFQYNCHMNHTDRIKHWVRECESTLREVAVQLVQRSIEYTLSDFPLLPLSYPALAKLVSTTLPSIGILKAEEIEDAYSCSSSQQGMLISQAKQPTLYHMQIVREVIPLEGQGSADAQRFGVAWQKVVDRHPILRTVFIENMCDDGDFGQVVLKKIIAAVSYVQGDYEDDNENGLAKTLSGRCSNGVEKCRPPHRLTIYTTSEGRILLNLEVSHAIMDGISLSLIFRDLSLAYDNMLPCGPGPLYRNFVSYIQGQNATNVIGYWRQYVKGVIPCYFPVLDQGLDRQTGSGTIGVSLDASRLRTFCQQCGVSIYNVLRTAWALLLSSYLGEDDVCFGCIGSGREIPIPDVQDAVGPYISMLICRVKFNPTESISKVLHRVQNDFLSSLPYQHTCHLAEIQHELRMCGRPLFNSGISVQKWQTESWKSGTFEFRDIKWEDPSEYDIVMNAIESKETISLTLRYLKRGMSEKYVSNIACAYATALREIISNPGQDIKQFRLFNEWKNNGTSPDTGDACLSNLAEDQACSSPDLTAPHFLSVVKRAPSSGVENQLQQIWAKVLNVQTGNIGVSENFFELGGDSVVAMRLVASARSAGICLSMADVFNHPRLSDLSRLATAAEGATDTKMQPYTPLKSEEVEGSFFQNAPLQYATSLTSVEIEKQVQQIWVRALNVPACSIKTSDNFFKLGGDSFTAMRSVAFARDVEIHLSVADIFGHPILSDLSLALSVPDRLALSAKRHIRPRFSSLNLSDVEGFLEGVVCPQISSNRSNIEDALVATDIQAAMIAFGLSQKRGNIHYFTLDFDGYVNSSRLESACQAVVSHHPIFRTVFFAHQLRVFQIVLRSFPFEFQRYKCEGSIEDLSEQLINTDKSLDFAPGDGIVRFMFLERGAYNSRLIMKFSHAQYDGLCFPTVIRDLKTAYFGERIEARPSFSDFVYAVTGKNEMEAEQFWRTLLKNSSMTTFSHCKIPSYENHIDSFIVRSIPTISLTSQGITFASLAKAAWAFVLAQLSGLDDVVFGQVVSGRNLLLEGIDQIVGPCINAVPVRVRFQSSTVLDLLHLVQNQHLEAIPFETMGFRHIVKRCTGWPLWSRFGSVVQHQNLDEILTSYRFGDVNCNIGAVTAPHDVVDIAILTSLHGASIDVSLNYSKRVISRSFAEEVLESLCSTIMQFSMDVNAQLPSPSSWSTPNTRIPFPSDDGQIKQLLLCNDTQLPKASTTYYQSIVERAWKFVLNIGGDCAGDDLCDPNIPFFDIWGDLFAAAQLSAFYRREGICITVEEILGHPTMHLQTILAAQRLGIK